MINNRLTLISALAAMGIAASTQAHDPKEHMKDAENPNCAAMSAMDTSNMDMEDPVAQAMMKKCMGNVHHDGDNSDDTERVQPESEEHPHEQHSKHQ